MSLTEIQLKALVDGIFQFAEQKEQGHPIVIGILKGLNAGIDQAGIPALLAFLQAKGVA